MVTTGHALS